MYAASEVVYRVRPEIDSAELNVLHAGGFGHPIVEWDWTPQLENYSLTWIGAFRRDRLVGFVNLAWDGGVHAFLLDTVVDVRLRGRGIGTRLVREAIAEARRTPGIEWVHVDSDETLMRRFYFPAGFEPVHAGTVDVSEPARPST